jgi:hypothetical protein
MDAREQRALLATRFTFGRRRRDIENSVRGLLRGFGVRAPALLRGRWDAAVRDPAYRFGASIVIRAGYPLPPAKATGARQVDGAA